MVLIFCIMPHIIWVNRKILSRCFAAYIPSARLYSRCFAAYIPSARLYSRCSATYIPSAER